MRKILILTIATKAALAFAIGYGAVEMYKQKKALTAQQETIENCQEGNMRLLSKLQVESFVTNRCISILQQCITLEDLEQCMGAPEGSDAGTDAGVE